MNPLKRDNLCFIAVKRTEIKLIVFLFLLLPSAAPAQVRDSLMARLNSLESQVRFLEQTIPMRASELEGKLVNKSNELDNELNKRELAFREEFFWAKTVAIAGGSVSVIAVIIAIISFARKIHVIAEQKAREKFDALFGTEKDKLIALIKQQDAELQLKEKKNIIALHSPNTNLTSLRLFFAEMGFKNVEYCAVGSYQPHSNHDLIFFYDELDDISQTTIQDLTKTTPSKSVCFYFGKKTIRLTEGQERFAYAQAKTQLYGNFMNALRYQKLLS